MAASDQDDAYQATPATTAQARCPHRIRDRRGDCATCGSIKASNGRWQYLTAAWFAYYADGAPRPEK